MMFIDQSSLDYIEDSVQLVRAFLVAAQQLFLHIRIVRFIFLQHLSILIQSIDFSWQLFLGHKEVLVLLDELMSSMLGNALHTNVLITRFAEEFIRLIMQRTELMIFANLFLLAGQLQDYEVFCEHVGFYLRVVLVAASRAIQELLLLIDNGKALLADSMPAI